MTTPRAIFAKDKDRALAAKLLRLLLRLQNGDGEDRKLGAEIVDAIGAPRTIGDPTGCLDCALYLADFLKIERLALLAWAAVRLRDRVRAGWKRPEAVTNADVARATSIVVVKTLIARLEGAPV